MYEGKLKLGNQFVCLCVYCLKLKKYVLPLCKNFLEVSAVIFIFSLRHRLDDLTKSARLNEKMLGGAASDCLQQSYGSRLGNGRNQAGRHIHACRPSTTHSICVEVTSRMFY